MDSLPVDLYFIILEHIYSGLFGLVSIIVTLL